MPARQNKCLILGLNPAWQKTLFHKKFEYGEVNRADSVATTVGGKGANVAHALAMLGCPAVLVQFAGGDTGRMIEQLLDADGVKHLTVRTKAATRTCTTVLSAADKTMTELIEPSPTIDTAEVRSLNNKIADILPNVNALIFAGTAPAGVDDDFQAELIKHTRDNAWIVLDRSGDIRELLDAGPQFLKINRAELTQLTGMNDVVAAVRTLLDRHPVQAIGVTAGADQAYLVLRDAAFAYRIPHLKNIGSPLGAGDAATAALTAELLTLPNDAPKSPTKTAMSAEFITAAKQAFAKALAVASASCMTNQPALFDPNEADKIKSRIEIIEIQIKKEKDEQ